MKSYKDLTGDKLEEWFDDLFSNRFKFENYVPSNGQISLHDLDPDQSIGEHLELDGLLLINKTCVIFEYTSEASGFKNKIEKFIKNAHIFTSSPLGMREKFQLCGISGDQLDDFEEVDCWKFVFFNTNENFEVSKTSRKDFPLFTDIQSNLFLFRPTQLEYCTQLVQLINKYARNEFLATLNFKASDFADDSSKDLDFIKLGGKYITSDKKIKSDLYLVKFKVDTLLKIARVSRHEGIPFILDDDDNSQYQRLLIRSKLNNISAKFIKNNKNMAFPNTLTLVLSNECEEIGGKLRIPLEFSSLDIIDGQHRLFAYTHDDISDEIRNDSEIMASVIKFRGTTTKKISQYSAKVFCDINSNQAKVKNNLIYLIKYDVLGEKDLAAIAGKILLECDKAYKKALSNMLLTNSLRKRTPLNTQSIPITTIVDNDLIPFLKGLKINKSQITETEFTRVFGNNRAYFESHYGEFWKKGKEIIETYFNAIKSVFSEDWKINSNSLIHSSKYYSAFIRFLRFKLFDENKSITDMRTELETLKTAVDLITSPSSSPTFDPTSDILPAKNKGIGKMFDFLKDSN